MKKFLYLFFAACLGSLSLTAIATNSLPLPKQSAMTPINRIVAIVNQEIITQMDLNQAIIAAKQQLQSHHMALPPTAQLQSEILNGLINQKLQLQLAKQNKITVSDTQVNAVISNIAQQNHISITTLKQKLSEQNIAFSTFKKQIKDQLIINSLQQQAIGAQIHFSKDQVAAFKQTLSNQDAKIEYHIVDYLIPFSANMTKAQTAQALQAATQLIKTLNSGNKPPASVTVNDFGWKTIDDLPNLFASYIVKMHNNSLAGPILAGNGYHVLQLLQTKRQTSQISDTQAQQLLFRQTFQKKLKAWLKNLRSSAFVKVYLTP